MREFMVTRSMDFDLSSHEEQQTSARPEPNRAPYIETAANRGTRMYAVRGIRKCGQVQPVHIPKCCSVTTHGGSCLASPGTEKRELGLLPTPNFTREQPTNIKMCTYISLMITLPAL